MVHKCNVHTITTCFTFHVRLERRNYDIIKPFSFISRTSPGHFLRFFSDLQKEGILNKTMVIFGADHGVRKDFKFFNTKAGSYESRLPLMYIIPPIIFKEKYKTAFKALAFNAKHRMTSQFDLYHTLKSVLHNDYLLERADLASNSRYYGTSLLRVLPSGRTCEQAGIPSHYCACGSKVPISNSDPRALKAGELLIKGVNSVLESTQGKCVVYNKFRVTSANLVLPSNDIMLTIETRPERALLRATIRLSGGNITLFGIERLDSYADVTSCVSGFQEEAAVRDGMERRVVACICRDQAYKVMVKP